MSRLRLSVRTKLTALYGGLFLLVGIALLVINYLLVQANLPQPASFAAAAVQASSIGPACASPPSADGAPDFAARPAAAVELVTNSLDEYRASALANLLAQSSIALAIAAGLAVLLGWLMASRVLRPVHEVTAVARKLSAENLDRRINFEGPSDELKELADTFDQMLARLGNSFDSQRRFVANASHELRTPLAVQRTLIEVALADPLMAPHLARLGKQLLDTNERSERMTEGLLTLARSDRGLQSRSPVHLDEVAEQVVRSLGGFAAEHEVEVRTELQPRLVAGDPILLERLVTNLVQNAILHNVPGGSVVVRSGVAPALTVQNTGSVIPLDAVPALFEPFERLGQERTADRPGAGLGLSIVRSVARAHHGEVHALPVASGGLVVEVSLPESK